MVFYQYSNPNNRKGSHPIIPGGQIVEFQQQKGKSHMGFTIIQIQTIYRRGRQPNIPGGQIVGFQFKEGKSGIPTLGREVTTTLQKGRLLGHNSRKRSLPQFQAGKSNPNKLESCWSPTILPNNGKGRCTALKELTVKTCKNPTYVAEGGITTRVTMHTMLPHLVQALSLGQQMTAVGTIGLGSIPPSVEFCRFL